jgi:hypothetical protein
MIGYMCAATDIKNIFILLWIVMVEVMTKTAFASAHIYSDILLQKGTQRMRRDMTLEAWKQELTLATSTRILRTTVYKPFI